MGKPLANLTIAVTGDFGERRDIQKMRTWIQVNGGTFAAEMSPEVTHLICSKAHYKKNTTMVQQARKVRSVQIVSFDWLEDSLMKQRPKNTRYYLLGPRTKARAEVKAKKKEIRRKNIAKGMETFEKGCKDFQKEMHSQNYGIYHDTTNFAYDITLARANLLTNRNSRYALKVCLPSLSSILTTPLYPAYAPITAPRARLHAPRAQRLQLYTSHAVPKLFACYVKYSAPEEQSKTELLAPIGSSWETAWGAFELFFKLKTRREWEGRFERGRLGPDAFVYTPPKEGEPRGLLLENEG